MKLVANKEIVLKNIKGNAIEIAAEINPKNAQVIELNVLRSPNKEEYTRIIIYKEKGFSKGLDYQAGNGTAFMPADLIPLVTGEKPGPRNPNVRASLISIESSFSSTLPDVQLRAPETAPFILEQNENIKGRHDMRRVVLDIRRNALLFDARTIRGKHRWEAVALAGFIDAAGAPVRVQALQTWLTAAGQHSPLDRTGISRLLHAMQSLVDSALGAGEFAEAFPASPVVNLDARRAAQAIDVIDSADAADGELRAIR